RGRTAAAHVVSLAAPFRHREGFAWSCGLPAALAAEGDTPQHKYRSPWQLLEDGNPIGRSHVMHAEISDLGAGRYSHWGETLYFSTSDNSDPNANGRRYSLARDSTQEETSAGTDVAVSATTNARVDATILDFLGNEI